MKKVIVLSLCFVLLVPLVSFVACSKPKHAYEQEYVAGQGNIKGDVDVSDFLNRDERFAIGATKEGVAVFKNPEEAYCALLEKYSLGLDLIKNEMNLKPVSQKNYEDYKTYGWQVCTGTKEAREGRGFARKSSPLGFVVSRNDLRL